MAVSKDNMRAGIRKRERGPTSKSMKCPSCGFNFIRRTNGKYKLRTRVLIFTRNGNTMGICPKCKTNLKVPITLSNGQKRPLVSRKRKGDGGNW